MDKPYPTKENFEPAKWSEVKYYACEQCKHTEMVLTKNGPPELCRSCFASARSQWNEEERQENRRRIMREDILDLFKKNPYGMRWAFIRQNVNRTPYSTEKDMLAYEVFKVLKLEGVVKWVPGKDLLSGQYELTYKENE